MSKSRSRRYKSKRPTTGVAPEPGSKGFLRVLNRGCGGASYSSPINGTEYYCRHDYGWACDDCPIVSQRYLDEVAAIATFHGPPGCEFYARQGMFWSSSVATELEDDGSFGCATNFTGG